MPLKKDADNNNTGETQKTILSGTEAGLATTDRRYFVSSKYSAKLFENLNSLRNESRFCDVEIRAGDRIFNAHRIVLSASSAYFEAMFRPELAIEGKQKSVTLHTVSPEIFKGLLDFIYTGKILINQTNVQEILAAADMLELPEIVEGCCEFLCRELHATNALGILRFAEAHHCEKLEESAMGFINAHFPQVANEDELLDIPQNLLIRIMESESLRVDTESQVFNAAIRWILGNVTQRRRYVFDVLANVRLPLVPIHVLDGAIKECRDVSMCVALRSIRKDLSTKRGQLVPLRVCPRAGAKKNIYIIGGSRREPASGWNPLDCIYETVVKYDIFRREWNENISMEIGRILPGVATLGGKIFVVGGERGSQILANGEVYDPQNKSWHPVAPMNVPRCEFGLCAVGGTLWAVGGWIGEDIGDSIECYDPCRDEWTIVGELPKPRFSMGVVSFEGLIYIVGGCTSDNRHLPDLISYNPVTNEWTQLTQMPSARCQMGVTVLDRYLYVVGGNSSQQEVLRTVERYSFDENKWSTLAPMTVSRASPAVAAADGLLYVAGGDQTREVAFYRAQITISSVECYDPNTDTWMHCPDLPMSRSEAGAVVV